MKKKELWTDLSDEQCQKVVGGTGFENAGKNAWGLEGSVTEGHALLSAGFEVGHNPHSAVTVVVPV